LEQWTGPHVHREDWGKKQGFEPLIIPSREVILFSNSRRKGESLETDTFIGAETDFQGEFIVKGTLMIAGRIDGRVQADCVIVGETAVIKGEVTAPKIVVGGRFEGNLRAQEIVEIKSTGRVSGSIFANRFSVTEGGEINGKIEMKMNEPSNP
jgi:cytoskeletal protein CcmA (bactofilin family)